MKYSRLQILKFKEAVLKENTLLNKVKTKASTLGMTALLTLSSVSHAFAEQTGGNGNANPANEATKSLNDLSGMLRIVFPSIAVVCGIVASIMLMLGDKKRTVGLDWLMWILIGLCVGSSILTIVNYVWQPK